MPFARDPAGEVDALSRPSWNLAVASLPDHTLFQSWAWGEAKAPEGYRPVRIAIRDSSGAVTAAAQALWRKAPLIPAGLLWVPSGPLARDTASYAAIVGALVAEARRRRALLVLVPAFRRGDPAEATLRHAGLAPSDLPVASPATFRVDIARSEEEILAAVHPTWRYDLRKGTRSGVTVRRGAGAAEIAAFLALYRETAGRKGFEAALSDATLRAFVAGSGDGVEASLFIASHEGRDLAGAVVAVFGAEARYLWAGSSAEGRKVMPSEVLQWEAIRWARGLGARLYDLHGASVPGSGVFNYKKRLGGELVELAGAWAPEKPAFLPRLVLRFIRSRRGGSSR